MTRMLLLKLHNVLSVAGGGCFKCGSTDHIAKDCTGDPNSTRQLTKYMLKDGNTQHGGANSRFVTN